MMFASGARFRSQVVVTLNLTLVRRSADGSAHEGEAE